MVESLSCRERPLHFLKKLRWNSHNIKINHCKVYTVVTFSTFTELCNHHLYLVLRHFHTLKGDLMHIKKSLSIPTHPLATTILLRVSVGLSILDFSYKWNHTICDLYVWLLSLSMFSRSIHVIVCISISFLFMAEYNIQCMDIQHFVYSSICWWTFGLFLPFGYCK